MAHIPEQPTEYDVHYESLALCAAFAAKYGASVDPHPDDVQEIIGARSLSEARAIAHRLRDEGKAGWIQVTRMTNLRLTEIEPGVWAWEWDDVETLDEDF